MSISQTPKFHIGLTLLSIILPTDTKITKPIQCQIYQNKTLMFSFPIDKAPNRIDNLSIAHYTDKIQFIFIEQGSKEPLGCVSFIAKLFFNFRGQTISQW